jgi:ferredoxin
VPFAYHQPRLVCNVGNLRGKLICSSCKVVITPEMPYITRRYRQILQHTKNYDVHKCEILCVSCYDGLFLG